MTGRKFSSDKVLYHAFIEALRTVRQRYSFSLYAYVLMSNHLHLLLEVDRFPTARVLQSLLTGYLQPFNKIHPRRGQRWMLQRNSFDYEHITEEWVDTMMRVVALPKYQRT